MDIAGLRRSFQPHSAPRPGAHYASAEEAGITTSLSQDCVIAFPQSNYSPNLATVTVTSLRPGVAGHVSAGVDFVSRDSSYESPTTRLGKGDFTATNSQVIFRFVVLPWVGLPVIGYGAEVDWADGTRSWTLNYVFLECNPWTWWAWPTRVLNTLIGPFSTRGSSTSRGSGTG